MPDFSNNSTFQGNTNDTTAPYNPSIPTVIPGFENLAAQSKEVASLNSLEDIMKAPAKTVSYIPGTIPYKEVADNSRYGMYNPSVNNMEDYAAHGQSWLTQLGNSLVKTGAITLGTFAQGLLSIPDTISAISSGDFEKLYNNPIEAKIDEWKENIENKFPNYYTDWEREHPFISAIPFVHGGEGFANFWGDKVVKNLGFTAGAIASAVVQDLGVAALTNGLGEIPLVANQIGKAALWINKLFTGTNDVAQVLKDAKLAGATADELLSLKTLGELAAAQKVTDKGRYLLNLWSSARTEGAIEARDGYNTVKEDLITKYKESNNGLAPEGADLEEIENYAKASANVRMAGNLALLSISNAIQFDNILKPFSSARSLRSSVVQAAEREGIKFPASASEDFALQTGLKNSIFNFIRKKIPEIISEGPFEEGGQFAIQEATRKYYEDKYNFYKNPKNTGEFDSLSNIISSSVYGLGQEFGTNEGLENVLLGSLTAVITGGIKNVADKVRGTYRKEDVRALGFLNSQSLLGTFGNNYKDANNSLSALQDMQEAIKNNDIFQYKNLKHKEFFNFIQGAVKSGRFDVKIEQLKLLLDLTQEEFERTFDIQDNVENRKSVQEYVAKLITTANNIKAKYDRISNVFTNPFRQSSYKDTTEEQALEGQKWNAFEDYKTQLAYLSSIQEDVDIRINDISAQIEKISPLVSPTIVSSLMSDKKLQELRDEYLEKYSSINEGAQVFKGKEKTEQTRKAQNYKNKAEEINQLLRYPDNEELRSKTLEGLINFIINAEGLTTDKSIPKESVPDLFEYGRDINRLQQRKKDTLKYYDALTTEKGFNEFFNKRVESSLDVPRDEDKGTPFTTSTSAFQEGRTYSTPNNFYRTKKTPDGNWSLIDPKGNIVNTFPSQKEARDAAKEQNNNRKNIKIVQTNEDGSVKVELPNGDIVDLQKYELAGYALQETPEEVEKRKAAELAATQKDLFDSQDKGRINTDISSDITFEDKKKHSSVLFASTVAFSAEDSGETPKPHHLRANYFASHTLPNMKNSSNVRGIVINQEVEKRYGLDGLTALSVGGYTPKEGWNDDNKLLIVVAVEQQGNTYHFLDENGKRIGKLGTQIDLNLLVFQVMPTPSLTSASKGRTRYRNNEGLSSEDLSKLQDSYKQWRKKMLSDSPEGRVYSLSSTLGFVNKGVPQNTPRAIPSVVKNISSPIIKIATTGKNGKATISNGIQAIEVPLGYPLLVTSNTIQPLSNRKLSDQEKSAIYGSLLSLSEYAANRDIKNSEAQAIINYLRSVVFWGTPKNEAGHNSIWFSGDGMLHFGQAPNSIPFTPDSIKANKNKINSFLDGMYNSINATLLNDNKFNDTYNEIIGWKGNSPIIRQWKNYQTYLISDKNPDNSSRSISEIPLTTTLPPILPEGVDDLNAQTRNGAYFILNQLQTELYQIQPKQQEEEIEEQPPTQRNHFAELMAKMHGNKQGVKEEKEVPNNIEAKKADIERRRQEELNKLSSDYQRMLDEINSTGKLEKFNPLGLTGSIENIKEFINNKIKDSQKGYLAKEVNATYDLELAELEKQHQGEIPERSVASEAKSGNESTPNKNTTVEKQGEQQAEPVSSTASLEQKKADIERRRQEELSLIRFDESSGSIKDRWFVMGSSIRNNTEELVRKDINAKYDAELAALQAPSNISEGIKNIINTGEADDIKKEGQNKATKIDLSKLRPLNRNTDYRTSSQVGVVPENWKRVQEWMSSNLPNIPIYRVKNMLHVIGDTYAWGAYSEGAIYLYENAELGTFFHEAFHAVARNFLSNGEITSLRNEFRQRKGEFTEYSTGNKIEYSKATDSQIDEQLAEEFREYSLSRGEKSLLGKIGQFFKDLWNWIKEIATNKSTINSLFRKINAGKYRNYSTGRNIQGINDIDFANDLVHPDYKLAPGEKFDILQHIQGLSLDYLLARDEKGNSKGLLNIQRLKKDEFYSNIKDLLTRTLIDNYVADGMEKLNNGEITNDEFENIVKYRQDLLDKIEENWDDIVKDHQIMMKAYNIEFDENDVLQDKNENKSGRGDYQDATKVDPIKKSTLSMKLLFSTIRQVTLIDENPSFALQETKLATSSVGGDILVEMGKSFVTVLDNLADRPTFDAQIEAFVNLANNDPNYIRLFSALRGSRVDGRIQWDKLSGDDLRLLIMFSKTFSKQKPETLLHYILEDGTAVIRSADYAKQTDVLINKWTSNIIDKARKGDGYLFYDKPKGDKLGGYYTKGIKGIRTTFPADRIKFLNDFGISVSLEDYNKLSSQQKQKFDNEVSGIVMSLSKANTKIATLNRQTLDISKRINTIATLIAKIQNPSASSTFFNQNGELQQTYIEKNYVSHLLETLNSVNSKEELNNTIFSYLNTDQFSKNSILLDRMFDEEGNRTAFSPSIGYITGTVNQESGKSVDVDRLTKGARLLQEINANLSGYYHLLEPADSATQWVWNIGQMMSYSQFEFDGLRWNNVYSTFSKYLIDEINLVRDGRTNVPNADKLRFFDGILNGTLTKEQLLSDISPEELYTNNKAAIDSKVKEFLSQKVESLKSQLFKYNILTYNDGDYITFNNLNTTGTGIPSNTFSPSSLDVLLLYLSTNYALSQMELFKVVFGDPHQSKEWLKRAKSFFSPRESTIHSSPDLNNQIDEKYNGELDEGEIGYMPVTDSINTATLADVKVATNLYKKAFVEPDAQGIITDVYYRQIRIKAGLWNDDEERQYQYDKAWERLHKNKYINESLKEKDRKLVDAGNPQVASAYYPLKPIATGNKNNAPYNAVVLDKYSLAPISYRAMYEFAPNSNMLKLLDKMYSQNIGYVVFESGRKIGNEYSNELYSPDGTFNTAPLQGIISIPFENIGIQVQTQPKEEAKQIIGSQLTKLVTIDMMAGSVPIDYIGENWNSLSEKEKKNASPLYEEIKHNQEVLEELQNDGYYALLKDIGVEDEKTHFVISDRNKVASTIERALLRNDSNDNSKKAIQYFKDNLMSLESTNMYQQFKNILYSIVDRNIVSPKVTGGPKVQIASTLFEETRTPISSGIYGSTDLKEYEDEDGKRHIEVYISSSWLRKQLPKSWSDSSKHSYKSDEELYKLVDLSILQGVGFRIPTQAPNSSDVFVIKKFLPIEMGDAVVVPSSMTMKGGSDFDIDKLNTYLKNVYWDGKSIKPIPFYGIGDEARRKLSELKLQAEVAKTPTPKESVDLEDFEFTDEDVPYTADDFYTKSIQNEYFSSLARLLSSPVNFQRLTKPNDASLLKGIAADIRKLKGEEDQNTSTPAQLLDRIYVTSNRHNFVTGKNAVGISALAQTGHSLRQRIQFTIDPSRLASMDSEMREWLGDGKLKFGKINYNTYNNNPSLSEIYTANKKYLISDILSQFIDGAVDVAKGAWIVDLLGDIRKLPTALLMTELGFDPSTTAYFLNQPIIEDYLQKIDNAGYNWLFIDSFVDELLSSEKYKTTTVAPIIYTTDLEKTIGKEKFTDNQKANQKLILNEFLKLTKMANHLFMATQGTNWDTTDFTDAYIVFKKNKQLEIARKTIFSGIDEMLSQSFIGNTRNIVNASREAIAQYIPTDSPQIRGVIESVLSKYINQPNREFVKTSRAVVNSFIDYAVQMKYGYNGDIQSLMLDPNSNVAQKLKNLLDDLEQEDPNNDILNNPFIKNISFLLGERTNNLTISGKLNSVYDQNTFIHALQELKYNPRTSSMYKDIITLSLLQGIGNSPISFTQLLPVEDVKDILSPIFDNLNNTPELFKFAELNAFERNNWNNTDLVPSTKLYKKSYSENNGTYGMLKAYANVFIASQRAHNKFGTNLIAIDSVSRVTDGDVITVTFNKEYDNEGNPLTKKRIEEMRKKGDYSFLAKMLFKKVYASPGIPLKRSRKISYLETNPETGEETWKQSTRINIFYKAINAWGDSFRLQEYYSSPQPSQVNNGYEKIPIEYSDKMITDYVRNVNIEKYENSQESGDSTNNNDFPNKDLNISEGSCG